MGSERTYTPDMNIQLIYLSFPISTECKGSLRGNSRCLFNGKSLNPVADNSPFSIENGAISGCMHVVGKMSGIEVRKALAVQ